MSEKPPMYPSMEPQGQPPPGYPQSQQPGYPPPGQQPAYQPPPPVQGPTVIVAQPMLRFGRLPQGIRCPYCQADVTTSIEYSSGWLPWAICGGIAFLGLFFLIPFLLCWIPFVIDSCKDVEHKCPNCHRLVGKCNAVK